MKPPGFECVYEAMWELSDERACELILEISARVLPDAPNDYDGLVWLFGTAFDALTGEPRRCPSA